jgi:hypothetical protein
MVRTIAVLAGLLGSDLPGLPGPRALAALGVGDIAAMVRPGAPVASCGTGLLGDVTGDGAVNVIDAQQILRWSLGLSVSEAVEGRISTHGDVTGDGNVNIIDAQQVLRSSVGLTTSFPIGDPLPACEGIRVTTSTTGQSLDPDGYSVFLDGGFQSNIGVNSTVDLPGATPGGHTVALQGLAANCSITNGPASRSVTVVEGEAVSVDYTIQCTGTGQGTLEVRNTTSGSSPPSSPYSVTLDGASTQSMPVGGNVVFNGVSFGSHQVTLGDVPGHCTVTGGLTQTVSVEGGFNILHYSITCGASPAPGPEPEIPGLD